MRRMLSEKDYYVGFSVFPGVGPVTFQNLITHFGTIKTAWEASSDDLKHILKEKKTQDFMAFRDSFDFEEYKERLEKTKTTIITIVDDYYPKALKEVSKPPFVLYVKGNANVILGNEVTPESKVLVDSGRAQLARMTEEKIASQLAAAHNDKYIAIVGTRKITAYGKDITQLFTQELVAAGFVIVSGLAMGVDYTAHKTTIENCGKTIAVLGCGVDCCYPIENQNLYDEILESGGAIVSEVPLGMPPNKGTFPARNRIIAGLSDAVLLTEGAEDSGALYTADAAFAISRPVFAIPGPITSQLSKGPYKLIEIGAKLVTKPEDILKELQINNYELRMNKKEIKGDTEEEQLIIDLLANESLQFDDIVRNLSLDPSQAGTLLSLMEVKGLIKVQTNGFYKL